MLPHTLSAVAFHVSVQDRERMSPAAVSVIDASWNFDMYDTLAPEIQKAKSCLASQDGGVLSLIHAEFRQLTLICATNVLVRDNFEEERGDGNDGETEPKSPNTPNPPDIPTRRLRDANLVDQESLIEQEH